jgi:hypothetical protein
MTGIGGADFAREDGLNRNPGAVAELGPGGSLEISFAALLLGGGAMLRL